MSESSRRSDSNLNLPSIDILIDPAGVINLRAHPVRTMLDSEKWFPTQADLPPLPLPSLADTCERYLNSVRPLLTPEEYAHTAGVVADFQAAGGVGESLQSVLEEKARTERNWMEEWWEQLAYLRTRSTMAIHINWFGIIPEWGVKLSNVQMSSLLLEAVLEIRATIESGKFPLEKLRGNPLDMHQFSRLFGMTRVPAEGADTLEQVPDSKHIVVMRDGALVYVPVYDNSGKPFRLASLKAMLQQAIDVASPGVLEDVAKEADAAHTNTSVLTALPRDQWAAERAVLIEDPTNCESLRLVESAILCVTFDRGEPRDKEEAARLIHGGEGRNKWFDKSLTAIAFENGRGGLNAEHTPVDAMTVVSIFVHALESIRSKLTASSAEATAPPSSSDLPPSAVRLLEWKLQPRTKLAVELASASIEALAADCEVRLLQFKHFGKGFVKRAKLHPDFFMQMAIQLAFHRMHRAFCATYETGHVRAFWHGRTDTVRTLSDASKAFCLCMDDADADAATKLAALKAACDSHSEQLQRVLTGQGIDRHLLGLYIASVMRGAPRRAPSPLSRPSRRR